MRANKTCDLCLTTLQSLSDYKDHISLEHNYSCICHLKFTSNAALEQHRLYVHVSNIPISLLPGSPGPLTCPLCLLSFTTVSKMSQHQQMKHKFVCIEQDCDTMFVSRVKLEEHTENVHNKSLEHFKHNICLVCGQVRLICKIIILYFTFQRFTRPENLRKHRKRPHVYQCELCVKIFTALDKKEQHCMRVHQVN